jgi:hypothetical protein
MNIDILKAKFIIYVAKFFLICYYMSTGSIARELWWEISFPLSV